MLRSLIVSAIVLAVAVATVAAASSLDVGSDTVQAGEDVTLQCDPGGIGLDFTVEWLESPTVTTAGFYITGFVISDVDQPACHDHQVKVRLHWVGFADTQLSSQVNGSTTLNFTVTVPRPADDLIGWDIAIHTGPT